MIVWGGGSALNTGGRYNPNTDSWTATSITDAPTARGSHTAVWTGRIMIVWGGADGNTYFNTGGRYNPGTDSWTATSASNAPTARYSHSAVWTGSEMIVWSGLGINFLTQYRWEVLWAISNPFAHTNTYGFTYTDTNPTATAVHHRAQRRRSLVDGKRP